MSSTTPPALKSGATIAFISPSARLNHVQPAVMSRATKVLTDQGYLVRELFTQDAGTQSSIQNRLSEIRTAFTDNSISAVICTIGGTTFTELLPALIADTELHAAIRANPKVVIGYSDITGLHWFLNKLTGLRTFYGPGAIPELGDATTGHENSPATFCAKHLFRAVANTKPIGEVARSAEYAPKSAAFWKDATSVEPSQLAPSPKWTWIREGKGQGRLFGGCLTVMARLGGVKQIAPDWRGRIVFLETAMSDDDVAGNPLFRIKAAVADLIAHGVFDDAQGLVVGRPFGYDSSEMQGEYMDVIRELLCEGRMAEKAFPILFNVDIGHTTPMVTLPYDALAVLDSAKDSFAILEPGVL
ncbi:peptidase u61 ld-carboxypeptidase a protein [Pochonia chlamydosporia 170]|uniref:Peptidase u61 ld-carboxypeptidase a protein n=1 Tax=Pochonia chlamydosporia 170 TaxID=1380566 RepID=A0A179G220_METCM|nr:peptidase u61 ld-carboxypeptidase a protein [Pochonia chlamydosporia 170]OAQ71423.1 peptidase u61 ld-carboxypeptidase a protein [Pochonia chlamydosporia 170]